ncbi:MAG: hypothetical protein LBF08_02290 [Dysgonamonadaceae bacterium]|jgi:hypothetical protein|nr:hypothetical protein [Dysgonamonadaceae bacterium]
MKKFILSLSILFIGFIAKGVQSLGGGTHYINGTYLDGTTYLVNENSGDVTILLSRTYIYNNGIGVNGGEKDSEPCIDILGGNKVKLILEGTSELRGGKCSPAIRVRPGAELIIEGSGELHAYGGEASQTKPYFWDGGGDVAKSFQLSGGAGIGGGFDVDNNKIYVEELDDNQYLWNFEIPDGLTASDLPTLPADYWAVVGGRYQWMTGYGACGDIIINSGTVEAYGKSESPGIGPAGFYTKGGRIEINGGSVYAQGGRGAPGIGCVKESYVSEIKVGGGNVIAEGGEGAPGIGGAGEHCYIEHINLEIGNVTAKAGNGDAVGIGAGRNSKINQINIHTDVTAESSREGIPSISALDGSAIEYIKLFDGNVTAKNGIGKIGDITDLIIKAIYFYGGAIDGRVEKGNGGTWKTYPNEVANAGDLSKYKLPTLGYVENPIYENENATSATIITPDKTKYTAYFEDAMLTTVEGLTVVIGGNLYDSLRVLHRNGSIVSPQHWYLTNEETGEVAIYRNERMIYKETARETHPDYVQPDIPRHYVDLSKVFTVGCDVENPDVNISVRYHDGLYPNNSPLHDEGEGEVTFIVHGETEDDVPHYRYIWYKDGVKVDEGEKKNTYTVYRQWDEDFSGCSVRLDTVWGRFTAGFNVIDGNNDVNTKIRYHDELYPNNSQLIEQGEGENEVTFIVHGADINDVLVYRYVWYKDGIKVDEGYENTYTVRKQFGENISGYSVKLQIVGDFTFESNNNEVMLFTGIGIFQTFETNPVRYHYEPASSKNLTVEVKTTDAVANQAAVFYKWNISGLVNGESGVKTFEYGSLNGVFNNTFVDTITHLEVHSSPLVAFDFNAPGADAHAFFTGKVLTDENTLTDKTDTPIEITQLVVPGGTVTINTDYNGSLIVEDYHGGTITLATNGPYYSVLDNSTPNANNSGIITVIHDTLANDLGNFIPGDIRLSPGIRNLEFTVRPNRNTAVRQRYTWTYSDAEGEHTIITTTNTLTLRDYNLTSDVKIKCELQNKDVVYAIKNFRYASPAGDYSEMNIFNLEHEITMPHSVDTIRFSTELYPSYEHITVKGVGSHELDYGPNRFDIVFTDNEDNDNNRIYKILVNRLYKSIDDPVDEPTGIAAVDSKITVRRLSNNILIDTPNKETISIYDLNGILIKKLDKEAGTVQVDLGNYRLRNFLVVRGADWVRKVW